MGRGWWLVLARAVLATALLLTGSRGGFVSAAAGLCVLMLAAGATQTLKLRHAAAMALPIVVAGVAFFLYCGQLTSDRLAQTDIEAEGRTRVYELNLEAIRDAPLLGTGYGTFEDVFRFYRDEQIQGEYELAHNTYLENVLELGLPAGALLFLSIAALFGRCLIGLRMRRRDAIYPCIGVGATVIVAVHSMVGFSMQIPAVAATYALIMRAAVAQSWSSQDRL